MVSDVSVRGGEETTNGYICLGEVERIHGNVDSSSGVNDPDPPMRWCRTPGKTH